MGAQPAYQALTESGGGPAAPGFRLYVGLDVGRRHHVVAAIPSAAMEDGSWERSPVRRVPTNVGGFTDLTTWLATSGPGRYHPYRVRAHRRLVCPNRRRLAGGARLSDRVGPELGSA